MQLELIHDPNNWIHNKSSFNLETLIELLNQLQMTNHVNDSFVLKSLIDNGVVAEFLCNSDNLVFKFKLDNKEIEIREVLYYHGDYHDIQGLTYYISDYDSLYQFVVDLEDKWTR